MIMAVVLQMEMMLIIVLNANIKSLQSLRFHPKFEDQQRAETWTGERQHIQTYYRAPYLSLLVPATLCSNRSFLPSPSAAFRLEKGGQGLDLLDLAPLDWDMGWLASVPDDHVPRVCTFAE